MKNFLYEKKIIADGAFGTYFSSKYETDILPEIANLDDKEKVFDIHKEYIDAGANLIRTNTFACNSVSMNKPFEDIKEYIKNACEIAIKAADGKAFVAGDIGPIEYAKSNENISNEYIDIVKAMIECGIKIFWFETVQDISEILPAIKYINEQNRDFFVAVLICANQYGYTNKGYSISYLTKELTSKCKIDTIGLNCGVGPSSMTKLIEKIDAPKDTFLAALPNASFPYGKEGRTHFGGSEIYFANNLKNLSDIGVDILGGCCGTSPQYIEKLSANIDVNIAFKDRRKDEKREDNPKIREKDSSFFAGKNKKMMAVELAPPFGADDRKIMDAANILEKMGVDALTLPDSPSGRTRADSILMGVKIMSETSNIAIPHICCRDRNLISLRSSILGAYMNGIRNMLVITGDPVPTLMRQSAKSVFNFDSVGLMQVLKQMNEEEFYKDPITYGGALSYNRPNRQVEAKRMLKKIDAGASFFMTQPLFTKDDIENLKYFKDIMDKENSDIKLFCGIMPLVSYRNALFIQNEMSGINVTDEIVSMYDENMTREQGEEVGVKIAKNIMENTKDFVDGYYLSLPFNRTGILKMIQDRK